MAKIGKHAQAKKYKELREKQRVANAMIRRAKEYLKPEHKALKNLKAKKKQFYNTRGLKAPAQLSFKNLSRQDLKAYERLLDSIINDTYLNEEKYNKHKAKQEQQFHDMGVTNVEQAVEVLESDIVQDLINLGLSPSDIIAIIGEYQSRGFDMNDFITMCHFFMSEVNADNMTVDDFFVYADYFMNLYDDFNARVDMGEYERDEFAEYVEEYYNYENVWD